MLIEFQGWEKPIFFSKVIHLRVLIFKTPILQGFYRFYMKGAMMSSLAILSPIFSPYCDKPSKTFRKMVGLRFEVVLFLRKTFKTKMVKKRMMPSLKC